MTRKYIAAIILMCCLTVSGVFAAQNFSVEAGNGFFVYGEDTEKAAEALGMQSEELSGYCAENGIEYIAVNENNSKQIRITVRQNEFTQSAVNISGFSDDKITSVLPQIVGINGVKGEIVNKDGQKFIKTQLRTSDSGGEYILTEYITVADKKIWVLSFYTNANEDSEYTGQVFDSFDSVYFVHTQESKKGITDYIVPAATVVFGTAFAVIAVTLLYDFIRVYKSKKTTEDE